MWEYSGWLCGWSRGQGLRWSWVQQGLAVAYRLGSGSGHGRQGVTALVATGAQGMEGFGALSLPAVIIHVTNAVLLRPRGHADYEELKGPEQSASCVGCVVVKQTVKC